MLQPFQIHLILQNDLLIDLQLTIHLTHFHQEISFHYQQLLAYLQDYLNLLRMIVLLLILENQILFRCLLVLLVHHLNFLLSFLLNLKMSMYLHIYLIHCFRLLTHIHHLSQMLQPFQIHLVALDLYLVHLWFLQLYLLIQFVHLHLMIQHQKKYFLYYQHLTHYHL